MNRAAFVVGAVIVGAPFVAMTVALCWTIVLVTGWWGAAAIAWAAITAVLMAYADPSGTGPR